MPRSHLGAWSTGKKRIDHQALKALLHMFMLAAGGRRGRRVSKDAARADRGRGSGRTEDDGALLVVVTAQVVGPGKVGRCRRARAREGAQVRQLERTDLLLLAARRREGRTLTRIRDAGDVEGEEDACKERREGVSAASRGRRRTSCSSAMSRGSKSGRSGDRKEERTCLTDLVLQENEDGRDDHDGGDEQVDEVPLAVPVGPHGRAEERDDRDGRRALREVVDVGHAPRLGADGDLVLHPERHEGVGPDALELAADDPARADAVSAPSRTEQMRT